MVVEMKKRNYVMHCRYDVSKDRKTMITDADIENIIITIQKNSGKWEKAKFNFDLNYDANF